MRFIGIVLLAAIVLGLAILGVNGILSYWDTDFIPGEAFPDAWTGPVNHGMETIPTWFLKKMSTSGSSFAGTSSAVSALSALGM